jgi:hypothetical protein
MRRRRINVFKSLAEKVGFEPTVPLRVHTLSKRAPSATRPPLQNQASSLRKRNSIIRNKKRIASVFLVSFSLARVHLAFRYDIGQPEDDAPFGVRQHDAALQLRDMSRGVFPSLTIGLKNQPTARDMSRNCKAVSCHRTPKSVPFQWDGCRVAQARCTPRAFFGKKKAEISKKVVYSSDGRGGVQRSGK